jgi:hypothetical protein
VLLLLLLLLLLLCTLLVNNSRSPCHIQASKDTPSLADKTCAMAKELYSVGPNLLLIHTAPNEVQICDTVKLVFQKPVNV